MAVVALLGSCKEFEMPTPTGGSGQTPNDQTGAIEYIYTGWVNYSGPMACQVELVSQSYYSSLADEAHYRLSWNACPVDPNTMSVKRLSIPHVHNGQTTYYNGTNQATYYFTGADQNYIYFKVISQKNVDLKMNIAIKTADGPWGPMTCKWFHKIYPDDGINNMYVIRL